MTAAPSSPRFPLTRRNLLIGGGAAVGLLIGFAVWPRERPLNLVAGPGETIMNGWLKIGADGRVIVICPQAEMGQGVYTSLPQILADELGADWRTVGVEPAPLHPIYANTVLAADGAKDLPGFLQGIGRWAITELVERYAVQATGGSTSVRAFYEPLRIAGATARAMLCKAAAREWDVDWKQCDTRNGFVIHESKRLRFADLAAKAAEEEPPAEPKLRAIPLLIGKSVPRIDIPSKTDGTARFGIDVRLPNMVFAAVRGGPVEGGQLLGVDAGKARALKVVQGDTWVAMVAETWWEAKTALDAVKARFETAERPAASAWMDKALTAALTGDEADVDTIAKHGDIDDALATDVVEARYSVPFLAHACMEPMTATARIVDGRAEVWAPTQSATLANWAVARALGMSEDDVTIFPTLLGGGFGRKAESDACVQAALIAREVGRPVQLIWSREEDIGQDKFRPAAHARLRATIGADKRIAAWDSRIAVPSVAPRFMARNLPALARGSGPNAQAVEGAVDLPYAIPNFRVQHAEVELPVPLGYWRSVGHSYTAFFIESFIDELAQAAGIDPLTFRLRMLTDKPRHAEALKIVASRGGLLGSGEDGGRGLAIHESFGTIVAILAEARMEEGALRVPRVTCAVDCGRVINPDIVRAQMEGAIIFGLSAALKGAITFDKGQAKQRNFDGYPLLTMAETPEIEVILIPSNAPPGGVGEPGVPPVAPAVANALFAATGERVRDLPFSGKML